MFTFNRCAARVDACTAMPLAWAGLPRAATDPRDLEAVVPAAVHRASLTGCRGADERRVVSWKAANEGVHRVGGWRTDAREAAAATTRPSRSTAEPCLGA